jgi:hypothetical protein
MQELQPTKWRRIIMLLLVNVVLMGRDNREYHFKSQVLSVEARLSYFPSNFSNVVKYSTKAFWPFLVIETKVKGLRSTKDFFTLI